MNKFLKYALWVFGTIILSVAGALAYVAMTFDPNAYKPEIIRAVQAATQRTLKINGDIKLVFFPNIGVNLSGISLSEFQSEQEFASVDKANISLALWPLLKEQLEVKQLALSGVRLHVVKYQDGRLNLDDLLPSKTVPANTTKEPTSIKFDVAAVNIEDTELVYRDEGTGKQYRISGMSLTTGRLVSGLPVDFALAGNIRLNDPKLDVAARLVGNLHPDFEQNKYRIEGMALQVNGSALDLSDLALKAGGDVDIEPAGEAYSIKKFTLTASGVKGKEPFEARLEIPDLSMLKDRISGSAFALNGKLNSALGKLDANLSLAALDSREKQFKLSGLSMKAQIKRPTLAVALDVSTTANGNLRTQHYNLPDIRIALNAIGDQLPGNRATGELKGGIQADGMRQSVQVNFAGKLLQSQLKAKASVNNFKSPRIRYDLEIDQFDADSLLPEKTKTSEAKSAEQAAEQPFDLAFLKTLTLDGSLRIGALKVRDIKVSKLRVDVKAKDGVATIAPLSANLYQGSMNGKAVVDANSSTFALDEKLAGVAIGPLLKDVLDKDIAEGNGNIDMTLTARGLTASRLRRSLQGKASVNLQDGAIKGIDLTKLVQGLQRLNINSRPETMGVNPNEKTTFSEFKASFTVKDGVAHNDDLAIKSTVLRLAGNGDIDIGRERMDYNAKVIFAKTEQGGTGTLPLKVSGPFDALKIRLDFGAMVTDRVKQAIDEKKESIKEKAKSAVQDELQKALKGLFK